MLVMCFDMDSFLLLVLKKGRQTYMFSKHTGARQKKSSHCLLPSALGLLAIAVFQASAPSSAVAQGLPVGGVVTHGSATITSTNTTMNINQSTANAVIGWGSFDIANGNSVNFQVPGGGGATLNQIAGPASQINGSLTSNGALFLVNPNGALFGSGANVNVGALVATTSTLDQNEFMNNHHASFTTGGAGGISNAGTITAGSGGYVVLAGAGDINNTGVITVPGGTIQMVSADTFTLTLPTYNPFLDITVDGKASGKSVTNSGTLAAGSVTLQAPQGTVRTVGTIKASSIGDLKGSVNLSGARVLVAKSIESDGDIKLNSSGLTQISDADLHAVQHIEINSGDSLAIGYSTLKSAGGNIDISTQRTLSVDASTLTTGNGNIRLSGKGGGHKFLLDHGAVTVKDSNLSASGNTQDRGHISIDGRVDTSQLTPAQFTSEKQGVVLNTNTFTGKNIDITGEGYFGVNASDMTFKADNLSMTGLSAQAFNDLGTGILFAGTNTLTAKNALKVTGSGSMFGVFFTGNTTLAALDTHVSGNSTTGTATDKNGIKFSGKLTTQSSSSPVSDVEFVSNGVSVTPPNYR
jgi:filamentous hemagglutinin family protein